MGVDTAALLTACSGVVAQDALYYGYDPRDPAEEIFMMQVIGLGLAETVSAKAAAYQQLTILTESLARNAAWHQLDQETFADVAQKFAVKFSQKLTRKKLLQLVPVVGVGIGAALNWTGRRDCRCCLLGVPRGASDERAAKSSHTIDAKSPTTTKTPTTIYGRSMFHRHPQLEGVHIDGQYRRRRVIWLP